MAVEMRNHSVRFVLVIIFGILLTVPVPADAAQWHLVMVARDELYSAVDAHRIETSLIQSTVNQVAVWVLPDFLRLKGHKYPKQPRTKNGKGISTEAYIWMKSRCG